MNLTLITGNAAKAKHLSTHLGIDIPHKKIDVEEIQSLDLMEVVTAKAKRAYEAIQSPVLVEDVALTFYALGNLPGPLIKWFVTELKPDGLCRLLNDDRRAQARMIYAIYDGKQMDYIEGSKEGRIALSPRGQPRFAWDNIFIPDGFDQAWSEMSDYDFNRNSHRGPALDKLRKFLEENKSRYI